MPYRKTFCRRDPQTREPFIDQGSHFGWPVSWNPDDQRFHVANPDKTSRATFKDWRNVRQWTKEHAQG
jgi:hypothetical protein